MRASERLQATRRKSIPSFAWAREFLPVDFRLSMFATAFTPEPSATTGKLRFHSIDARPENDRRPDHVLHRKPCRHAVSASKPPQPIWPGSVHLCFQFPKGMGVAQ